VTATRPVVSARGRQLSAAATVTVVMTEPAFRHNWNHLSMRRNNLTKETSAEGAPFRCRRDIFSVVVTPHPVDPVDKSTVERSEFRID